MKKSTSIIVFLLLTSAIYSCKKHLTDKPMPAPPVPAKEAWLAKRIRDIAEVLEQVYQNDTAYREVNAAIFSGYYADERVLLADLLFPESSPLYLTEKFRRFGINGVFKRMFWSVLSHGAHPELQAALVAAQPQGRHPKTSVIADDMRLEAEPGLLNGTSAVAIYFPYSGNFVRTGELRDVARIASPTIVGAAGETDFGGGHEPYTCPGGSAAGCYRQVTVNDEYAESRPTHIIETGARPVVSEQSTPPQVGVTRVYLGWARLTRQMDALISLTGNGGGSEIKVGRIDGYLKKEGEQVTSFSGDLFTLDYTRKEIRNREWKRVYTIWDPNWTAETTEQVYAVYEDDTKGTRTLSGSLSASVNLPGKPSVGKASGELSYKVEVSTQDEIITQRKLDRDSFLKYGRADQGWKFIADPTDFLPGAQDWPIWDGGTIWQYSMPWKAT